MTAQDSKVQHAEELSAEELLARIEKMKPLYYKVFGNILQGIVADAYGYVNYPEERSEWKPHAQEMHAVIDAFYENIPFNQIEGDEDFVPIFQVKELMPYLGKYFRRIFGKAESKERDLHRLAAVASRIGKTGYHYRTTFLGYIGRYRKLTGNRDFVCAITDRHGVEWKL